MITVLENFLPNPDIIRADALSSPFIDWEGLDGALYKRICIKDIPGLQHNIEKHMGAVDMLGMAYRLNYAGECPNAAIHSDLGWGTHALVLFLCEGPSNTSFWQHKATQAERIDPGDYDLLKKIESDWNDESKWNRILDVPVKYNRALIYDSSFFHSRYPFEAFGETPSTGRLIAVAFFTPKEISNAS